MIICSVCACYRPFACWFLRVSCLEKGGDMFFSEKGFLVSESGVLEKGCVLGGIKGVVSHALARNLPVFEGGLGGVYDASVCLCLSVLTEPRREKLLEVVI